MFSWIAARISSWSVVVSMLSPFWCGGVRSKWGRWWDVAAGQDEGVALADGVAEGALVGDGQGGPAEAVAADRVLIDEDQLHVAARAHAQAEGPLVQPPAHVLERGAAVG